MKCPYCNKEMTQGYIQCRDGVYWSEKKRPVAAISAFSGEMISLSDDEAGPFSGKAAIAFCCADCKKVIVDFQNK